ncbi:unnamed protein product [Ceratitis capitata]|uniref:(Mediterranean fruit fly) hypothetical protein n=1 Tax=Ceratitis capitata TaxID=7213 RepID=A0A811TWQ1_CERCA|nr:unnamed protein product [Ceratitis capitata]
MIIDIIASWPSGSGSGSGCGSGFDAVLGRAGRSRMQQRACFEFVPLFLLQRLILHCCVLIELIKLIARNYALQLHRRIAYLEAL